VSEITSRNGLVTSGKVMLGYTHNGTVRAEFMASVLNVLQQPAGKLIGRIAAQPGGTIISYARNMLTTEFLASPAEWLWMTDADMVFGPREMMGLLADADPVERPVITGVCAILNASGDGTIPNVFRAVRDDAGQLAGFEPMMDIANSGLVRADGCGAAFMLIHRGVLEKIAADHGGGMPWFRESVTATGGSRGEDLSFCVRLAEAGFPLWVQAGVRPGHAKTVVLTA